MRNISMERMIDAVMALSLGQVSLTSIVALSEQVYTPLRVPKDLRYRDAGGALESDSDTAD